MRLYLKVCLKIRRSNLCFREIEIESGERSFTQFHYDDSGALVREVTTKEDGKIEREISYFYDNSKRLVRKIDNYFALGKPTELTYVYE